jgi:hypothetical protein
MKQERGYALCLCAIAYGNALFEYCLNLCLLLTTDYSTSAGLSYGYVTMVGFVYSYF